jgi:UbiD family decarboxylase
MRRCATSSSSLPPLPAISGRDGHVASAPWQEVVVDQDINLYALMPLFRVNRGDGGYFVDKACVISRDPDD